MDRDELSARLEILKQEIEAGRLSLPQDPHIVESLMKVRRGRNGKVIPETVTAVVRALAATVVAIKREEELKAKSLSDVQGEYLDVLESLFGRIYADMTERGWDPHDVATLFSGDDARAKEWTSKGRELSEAVRSFWDDYAEVVQTHLRSLSCLKGTFSGDAFPLYGSKMASSVGLYIDTVVLPDPLLTTGIFTRFMKPDRSLYMTVKHALSALAFRELALADVSPPIVVFAPDYHGLQEPVRDVLEMSSTEDVVAHCSRMFDRPFADREELVNFLRGFGNAGDLVAALAHPERLLFSLDWPADPAAQMDRFARDIMDHDVDPEFARALAGTTGDMVYNAIKGRMAQAASALIRAAQLNSTPVIEAPTSWQYMLWKYEYDAEREKGASENLQDMLVCKALQSEDHTDLQLLGGLPHSALIELRRKNAMEELRHTIRQGLSDVDAASGDALADVIDTVARNIGEALSASERDLKALAKSGKRYFGFQVLPLLVTGGLAIAAAATGNTLVTLLAAFGGISGCASFKDLLAEGRELLSHGRQLRRAPAAILFRHLRDH